MANVLASFELQIAVQSDAAEITKVMRASKAHWGYSKQQMERWADEVMVTGAYIANRKHKVVKLSFEGKVRGFYSHYLLQPSLAYLDNMFLHPEHIGKGIGQALLDVAIEEIRQAGADVILLHSDPNAEAFYLKNGFLRIGRKLTSIPNRYLPIMSKALT